MEEEIQRVPQLTIIVNGQAREVDSEWTVADLLSSLNVGAKYVVVQLDGIILPRENFMQTPLSQGNKLEIVTLVGGG
jgi:sulfur carrier protein